MASFAVIFLSLIMIFIIAQRLKNNSIIDIFWGPGFVVICLTLMLTATVIFPSQIILFGMIVIWALRLATFILARSIGKGEDKRYTAFREAWGKRQALNAFLRVFMLQGVLMMIIAAPIFFMFTHNNTGNYLVAGIGFLLYLTGLIFESVADFQLYQFKNLPSSRGQLMTTGLWSVSRHPNYFGEIMLWWGIGIFSAAFTSFYSLIGPAVLNVLIVKVSGIPMLEQKYTNNPQWDLYKSRTPALIPFTRPK